METIYLRFPDEATALAALDGMADRGVTVDIIGEIPGRTGWHVNLRGEGEDDRAALAACVVTPAAPYRVFA
jgi:hypothetical protein